jgi:PAS domain S-box-containing protein
VEHPLEPFLRVSPSLFALADPLSGQFRWLSPQWEQLLGWPLEDLAGAPFIDFVHPEDVESTLQATAQLNTGLTVVDFYNRYRASDGSWRSLRWFARVHDGTIYAVAHDVSHTPYAFGQFEEHRRLLSFFEELSGLGHWSLDLRHDTLYWSPRVFKLHGLDSSAPQPTLEETVEFYHPEDRARAFAAMKQGIVEGEPVDFEHRIVTATGEHKWVHIRGQVRQESDGTPVSFFGVIQDITQRRLRTEAQAERVQGVATLTAGIAHELNNPLTSVMANLELLDESLRGAEVVETSTLRRMVANSLKSAEQVARIIRDLRALTSPREQPAAVLNVSDLIETALNMTRAELRKTCRIETDLHPTASILGVESELLQVLVNIIQNARYALLGQTKGLLSIRVWHETPEYVTVEIGDNGPGVPSESVPRLFEPFYTTKPIGEGTGLGLYVSHNIVEKHGGTLKVESTPGRTLFSMALPARATSASASGMPARPHVLVVDDDPSISSVIEQILEADIDVETSTDAESALLRLRYRTYDALVTDIGMPGASGWELLREVRRTHPLLYEASLVCTGAHDTAPPDLEDRPVLLKPFSLRTLRTAVHALLAKNGSATPSSP